MPAASFIGGDNASHGGHSERIVGLRRIADWSSKTNGVPSAFTYTAAIASTSSAPAIMPSPRSRGCLSPLVTGPSYFGSPYQAQKKTPPREGGEVMQSTGSQREKSVVALR